MSQAPNAAPSAAEPLPCTGARLRRLSRRMTVFYEQHLRREGLSLPQYSLLMHLSEAGQPLMALAERMEMDRTTLTRALKPLEAAGWVSAQPGQDARVRLFALTAAGRDRRRDAHACWVEAQLALEAAIGRDFVERLNQSLEEALARLKPALPPEN
jgi:DNA-binding MarR family transcriptional regulator